MNPILMAAARGARIELFGRDLKWHEAKAAPLKRHTFPYRIHPDDEHMRFGPISSALREAAEQTNMSIAWSCKGFMEVGAVCEYTADTRNADWDLCGSELHRSLFLLILSEALTEEGL